MKHAKVRLFVDQSLGQGQTIELSHAQAHYLTGVMRMGAGDRIRLFDGISGEWLAEIVDATRKRVIVTCSEQLAPHAQLSDIWLLFAPLKKARMDMVVEKAVELGAARLVPVLTEFTNSERVRTDRLRAQVIEAAEQCGATSLAQVADPTKLAHLMADWPSDRALIFCDEEEAGAQSRPALPGAPAAILIGPEGGFSASERRMIAAHPATHVVALGPRILRAETAALAALTLWQSAHGDWSASSCP